MDKQQTMDMKEIENDLEEQVLMPTHQDLINSAKYGLPIFTNSKTAVYVKKISEKHRAMITAKGNIPIEKSLIKSLHMQYRYDFLVDFQFKEDMDFLKILNILKKTAVFLMQSLGM